VTNTDQSWLLAIDSSSEWATIALTNGERVAETSWFAGRDQTATLLSEIDRLFSLLHTQPTSLNAVAVATGPGMFNGLRVGMSVAKGFVLALDLPLIGISTLDVTAFPHLGLGLPIVATVAAGRGRCVWAVYQADIAAMRQQSTARNGAIEDVLQTVEELGPCLVTGELTPEHAARVRSIAGVVVPPTAARFRRASCMAELAWNRYKADDVDNAVELEPVYLHSTANRR